MSIERYSESTSGSNVAFCKSQIKEKARNSRVCAECSHSALFLFRSIPFNIVLIDLMKSNTLKTSQSATMKMGLGQKTSLWSVIG